MAQSQKSKDKDKGRATAKGKGKDTTKKPERKLSAVPKKTDPKKKEGKEEVKLTPTTDCKVFGSPDPNHKKCRTCKDLDNCLLLQQSTKKTRTASGTKKELIGRDFVGFLKGSKKSLFALTIAKKPCTMAEIKSQPWNTPTVQTFYDTLNELRRHKTKDGEDLPLAAKDQTGQMFIVEKNLTKAQKDQMKAELEELGK